MPSEREPELDHLLRRLSLLGARSDELQAVRDGWGRFDEAWTADDQYRLVRARDADLTARLAEVRAEYDHGTTTEEEAATRERWARESAAATEAMQLYGAGPRQIVEWVGGDPLRAWAMVKVEESTVTPRAKVLAVLYGPAAKWEAGR